MWRKLVGDDKVAMGNLNMIIAGRIVRKLCMACKVAYTPDADQLRKLNMNPATATKLFQARREPMRDPKGNPVPCDFCKDLHYNGRMGIFEVMAVDDEIRNAVNSGKSINEVRAAFRKQKGKLLQEVALSVVEAGDTSLAEVKRVMEAGAPPAAAPASAPASGAKAAPRAPVRPT
jgi:type II secretory ATPase GspE/PulE/Tfp pilus assembly ATPase PilB-like protein